jgi:hypothetical protein
MISRASYALITALIMRCATSFMLNQPAARVSMMHKAPAGILWRCKHSLRATPKETQSEAIARRGERKGFYVRPSAAIEKGGGFFIPGFEGWKLRGLIASVLVFLLFSNRAGGYDPTPNQLVSEAIASTAVLALIVQTANQYLGFGDAVAKASEQAGDLTRSTYLRPEADEFTATWAAKALVYTSDASVVILFRDGQVETLAGAFERGHPLVKQADEGAILPLEDYEPFLEQERTDFDKKSPQAALLVDYVPASCTAFCSHVVGPGCFWVLGSTDVASLRSEGQQKWLENISKFSALGPA